MDVGRDASRDSSLGLASGAKDPLATILASFEPAFPETLILNPKSPNTAKMTAAWKAAGLTYNRYLAIAARAVRRSLKEDVRIQAERRGEMELRFAKWENGKQGDPKDLAKANAAAMAENASS